MPFRFAPVADMLLGCRCVCDPAGPSEGGARGTELQEPQLHLELHEGAVHAPHELLRCVVRERLRRVGGREEVQLPGKHP